LNYYEAFNLPHVDIVALGDEPIVEMTKDGLITSKGKYDLDVFVYATGFDAVTGPLTKIDIRNSHGQSIGESWEENGVESFLGLQVAGFPNLFTVTGLGSPSVLSNLAYSIEYHVNWIAECISYLREHQYKSIEPANGVQQAWSDTVNKAAQGRMYVAPSCNSWYLGSNIPGKQRKFLIYVGGCDAYDQHCQNAKDNGYQMFRLEPE
ncbi:MAG: cyclohexanone monooxygenase, partial [Pseudomonadales bacterium]